MEIAYNLTSRISETAITLNNRITGRHCLMKLDIVSSYFDENNNINYRKEYYKEQKQFLDDKFYQLFGKL